MKFVAIVMIGKLTMDENNLPFMDQICKQMGVSAVAA